ncbi:adenosine deaminase 2-like [Anthonomus grandis grandis]|uniref:adenosine deaminase 2-like n=1 Tax=Anthonomus grandis grandis TaxID=2921223 RepID=UPI0021664EAF|nr:adenosine deaminase 2-like [Anthonomus grandis grandis]XP_050295455.1 adenosine deaminase 2-like [Anthonomus grandis grandis]
MLVHQKQLKETSCPQLSVLLLMFLSTLVMCETDNYLKQRDAILKREQEEFIGGNMVLTQKEEKVNGYLLELKKNELVESYKNFSAFLPAKNFLIAKEDIELSKVFQFIKKVPKAASLHTHMLAGVNADYIIENFSYMENVYGCYNEMQVFKLRVLKDAKQDGNCSWKSLKTYRKELQQNNTNFDDFLKSKLTLDETFINQSRENVWAKFKNLFSTIYDLVSYKPLFQKFVYQLLKELYDDNVFYTELRGTFMPLYDLNGTTYDAKVFFETLMATVEDFKKDHPNFLGVKYIHSIYRGVDNSTLKNALEELIYFKSLYPDFIAGFDFVGLEEDGRNLLDFHEELSGVAKDLKFFFHAGETNQFGKTDLNLLDAILLNCSRVGHGFALAKHPELMVMARNRDIAVELCPISNQVLKLNQDPRNHPAAVLLSKNYPIVICNDDPSAWGATGVSYDWYVVFMSMTWENHGLAVLKSFALNSIRYSGMSEREKINALTVWERQWDQFIDDILENLS